MFITSFILFVTLLPLLPRNIINKKIKIKIKRKQKIDIRLCLVTGKIGNKVTEYENN